MKKTILCILLIFLFSSCSTQDISQNSDRFSEFTFGLEQYIDIIHNDLYPIIISDEKELNSKLFDNQVLKITKSTMDSFFLENIYLKNVTPLENNIFELNIIYKNYFDKLFKDCVFKIEAINNDEYKIIDYSFEIFDISKEIDTHWQEKAYDINPNLAVLNILDMYDTDKMQTTNLKILTSNDDSIYDYAYCTDDMGNIYAIPYLYFLSGQYSGFYLSSSTNSPQEATIHYTGELPLSGDLAGANILQTFWKEITLQNPDNLVETLVDKETFLSLEMEKLRTILAKNSNQKVLSFDQAVCTLLKSDKFTKLMGDYPITQEDIAGIYKVNAENIGSFYNSDKILILPGNFSWFNSRDEFSKLGQIAAFPIDVYAIIGKEKICFFTGYITTAGEIITKSW